MRTKHSIPQARPMRRRRLALALLAAIAAPAAMAQSLPYGGNVVSGGATIGYSGNTATVNQSTQGAIINWNNFNVGAGYGVTFNQPNASAVILNRVIGNGYGISPTTIDGALTANGHVFIVNSAGITFGSGAQVNVGGLVASTLAISDADFLDGLATGRYRFDGATGASQVRNDADLQAGGGGVALVGPVVINSGAIVTDGGSIGVGAGTSVTLDFVGDGLTQVTIDLPPTVDSGIVQDRFGSMTADGGRILLRTATTAGGTGGAIYASGLLRAQTMNNVAGRIELTSAGGTVMLGAPGVFSDANSPFTAGTIDVTGNGGQAGGSVLLSGADIILTNEDDNPLDPADPASFGSVIDASGDGGGGSVELLAGNTLGMLGHTSIRADARATGNGGSVRLDGAVVGIDASTLISTTAKTGAGGSIGVSGSDRIAAFGVLSARGATAGGDITTYSGGDFDLRGLQVDAGGGAPGSWTLWAPNIDVIDGADVGSLATSTSTPGQSVQDAEINTALANGTSVTLRAGTSPSDAGDIGFDAGVAIASTAGSLAFRADAQGGIYGDDFSIIAAGGSLSMDFNADAAGANTGFAGIAFSGATLDSNGGAILMYGQSDPLSGLASNYNSGISLVGSSIRTGGGDLVVRGASTAADAGSDDAGVVLDGTTVDTGGGAVALHGRGTDFTGGVALRGSSIASGGGRIDVAGSSDGDGAGIELDGGSSITAGGGLVVLRAGNAGASDAIRLAGTVSSGTAVNLRPGGVDADGAATDFTGEAILLGMVGNGFALDGGELARISAPRLVVGSSLHAGAIQVMGAIARTGDLTLQNDGGSGGIQVQAALDVGSGTLALSTGGSITQSAAGAITAHSLLARADGDVLLAAAQNNVAATTLAGNAGGDFEYQDVDALAIGNVTATGFDAGSGTLASIGASGIQAGGDVFVRNLQGDLVLGADVSGTNIDLVIANTLQNTAGASLLASGDWRVWASTWVGESRGGLAGNGALPNLYGCQFQGACGVSVPGASDHFIYVQQPVAVITFDDATREYGLPNPLFTFSVSGAILGDTAANVASGSATSPATVGSDVGAYPISGSFTSAAGYQLQFVPGTLRITPATLVFTADPFVRYLGTPNPLFTGTVTGFRNGDTVESVFGTTPVWSSPAGILSPIGYYPVNGGTSAKNYVFVQAPGNATALQVIPLPQLSSTPTDLISDPVNTYLYDRNIAGAPVCAVNATLDDQALAASGDALSTEWSKVRSRPNLVNCFDAERRSGCSDF